MIWSGFKRFFGRAENGDAKFDIETTVTEGLDIDAVIDAHRKWKLRLNHYLEGRSSETLQPETLCFDDRCDLGKWIYSTGEARLGNLPVFEALKVYHKMSHVTISRLISLAQAGKNDEAKRMLLTTYERESNSVTQALVQLRVASLAQAGKNDEAKRILLTTYES